MSVGVARVAGSRPRPVARHVRRRYGAGGRIPGLDGLRAFAVLAVIGYHTLPRAIPGGFLGVDVFFVVSGFLITTLLLREMRERGNIRLAAFWTRRARRLLPALAAVVVASTLAARVVEPDLLVGIRRQVLGAATFTTNWLEVAAGSSYFDERQPELLRPLWSLAIEEQFYVLWPVLLVAGLVVVRSRAALARAALAAAALSAVAMALLLSDDPTRVYYGTDTHAFGLLLGVAAAFAWRGRPLLGGARWAAPGALAGLVLLALVLRDDASVTYRGGLLLASLLAVVAVAGCTGASTAYVRALELRPLSWVGERSYGLYLWHWPVGLVMTRLVAGAPGTGRWWWGTALGVAVTFALAAASYRWVETPVRRHGFRATGRAVLERVRAAAGPRWAMGGVAATLAVAVAVVATAPRVSGAELAVEQGQQAIEDSRAGQPPAEPPPDAATAPAATSPTPEVSPTAEPSATPATPSADETSPQPVTGTDMIGFGDSVMSAAAPALLRRFPGIALDAKPIRKWLDAPDIVAAAAARSELRPVVVLAFGTNAGFQLEGSEEALREVLDIIGPDRRVVLVNSSGISYWLPDANARLAEIGAERPGTSVVDWYTASRSRPGLLHADDTHPTMAGIEVYADLVADALGAS
ncbi:acyltransferase family protein [Isoptericola sp. b490]|uniref:acyltransferase family protein n=1 Tax=Actinotalea lenta TaxID=3064654 RepID=UPI0027126E1A|nr:acyltransferase family protein [Isoptericola sp. b490]MDO8122331.1 acyltransferase family protein [Isoptericola sp. b490]